MVTGTALIPDGLEDEQICCIQEGAVEATAKDKITQQTSRLARHDKVANDMFADIEGDGEELEENENIIDNDLP